MGLALAASPTRPRTRLARPPLITQAFKSERWASIQLYQSPTGSHSEDGTTQTGSRLQHAASRLDGTQRLLRVERLGFDPFARCPISCASTTLGGMNGDKATRPEMHPDEAAAEVGIRTVPPAPECNTINLSKRETPNQPQKLWVSRAAR